MQEGKIISYASRALSGVEKRYSQTEKETLAIVWGYEHFHLYLFGSDFTLITDHKPLEIIFNNGKSRPPARIERWRLRLQPYDFTVTYRPGSNNPADYMSRHPYTEKNEKHFRHDKMAEEYLNFITTNAIPKTMTLTEIANATTHDDILQDVISRIFTGRWKGLQQRYDIQPFIRVKDELTIVTTSEGSILLCNNRIVIPTTLQQRVVNIAHEGHMEIVKTKQLLREKVWFPAMNNLVESTLAQCLPCLASTPCNNTEPIRMTKIQEKPWSHVSADFYGPLPTGEYLLVLMDDYSRFPIVEITTSISAKAIIPKLDKIFSMFGIPDEFKTDNGHHFKVLNLSSLPTILDFTIGE